MLAHFISSFFLPSPELTVIIPTFNESHIIASTVRAVKQSSTTRTQIIVADGFSTDDTISKARGAGAQVVRVRGGRGCQLNRAASLAKASNLLFLHADTRVPLSFDQQITHILAQSSVAAGAFKLSIASNLFGIKLVQKFANWRSSLLQRPYGDQGLFVTRRSFDQVGGFPPIPFLEDYEIVRRLSRNGRIAIAKTSVVIDARRWETLGVARTTLMNSLIILAYHLRVHPNDLQRVYKGALHRAVSAKEMRGTSS